MKYILFPLFILSCLVVYSQTDSLSIRLGEYKEMFVKGLINANEYESLKAKLLGLDLEPQQSKKDTMKLSTLIERRNNKLIGGTIMTTVGGGLGIGAMAWAISEIPSTRASTIYSDKRNGRVIGQVFMGVAGVGLIIGGIVLLTESGKDTQLIKDFRKHTAFVSTNNSIGLAFKF